MRTKVLLFAGMLLAGAWAKAQSTTAFVFQGQLDASGAAAAGLYDLEFALFDSATNGNLVAGPVTNIGAAVSNGLFAAQVDFGGEAFDGAQRWLQIGVRTNGAGSFTILSPLERITAAPYSITAINLAAPLAATNLSGVIAASNLPGGLITNGQGNVILSGAFSGNGANLTALSASALASGTVGLAQLPIGGPGGLVVNGASSVNLSGTFQGALNGNAATATTATTAGTATTATTASSAANFTGTLAGDVTGTQGATIVSHVGGQTAANIASGASAANAATSANTPGAIVARDASGNFTAGTIIASLSGNAATATTAGTAATATTASSAANFTGTLAGDVTGTQAATTVSHVGGQTAANIASGAAAASAATGANTPGAIVARDASGNFTAGTITASLSGNAATATTAGTAATATTASSAANFTGALAGDVTGTQAATTVSHVGGQTAANIASGAAAASAATSANTPGAIVARDASGNFTAGTITASLSGNAATATTAGTASTATTANSAANFTGTLAGDVTGTQGTTTISLVGGQTAANVASGALAANAATSANAQSTIVARDASGDFAAGTITASRLIANGTLSDNGPLTVVSSTVPTYVSITNGASAGGTGVVLDNAGNISASGNLNVAGTITGTFAGSIADSANFTGSLFGDVTGTQGATVVAAVGGQSALNVSNAVMAANAATAANVPNTIVARDGSGSISAGAVNSQNLTADGTLIVTNQADQRYVSLSDGNIAAVGGTISGDGSGLTGLLSAAGNPVADVYSIAANFAFDTSLMSQPDLGFATSVATRIEAEQPGTNYGWTVSTVGKATTFIPGQSGLYRVDYQAEASNDGNDTVVTVGAQTNNVTIPGSAISAEVAPWGFNGISKSFTFYFTVGGPAPTTSLSFVFTSTGGDGVLEPNPVAIGSLNCPSFSVTIQRLGP